jgi:hypothetical protein
MVLGTFAETKVSRRTGAKARKKSEVSHAQSTKLLFRNSQYRQRSHDKELNVLTVLYLAFNLVHEDAFT